MKSAEKAEARGPKLDSELMRREEKVSKMPKMAGDVSSKTGGNLDHVILDVGGDDCSTVLEAVQSRGHQVQGSCRYRAPGKRSR